MTPSAFEPTAQAAHARLEAMRPRLYPDTRGDLRGAVTRQSPYLTHGFLTVPDVVAQLREQHRVAPRHKLIFELAWREYFRHAWAHEGDAIFASLHAGPLPDEAYMREVPRDGRFVMQRMRALGTLPCMDRADAMVAALARARTLHGRFDPHLGPAFEPLGLAPVPEAFDGPQERCRSFSTWWSRTRLRDEAGGGPLAPAESQAESA